MYYAYTIIQFTRNKQVSLTLHRMYCSGGHQTPSTTTHGPCLSLSPEIVQSHVCPNIPYKIHSGVEAYVPLVMELQTGEWKWLVYKKHEEKQPQIVLQDQSQTHH